MTSRAAGVLLHPTSLPGPYGIGDLGPAAEEFLGWAASAGLTLWQTMPLGPTGFLNSPYGALSAFAGNPLLISPDRLVEEGFLLPASLDDAPAFREGRVDFGRVIPWKEELHRASFAHFHRHAPASARRDLEAFVSSPDQAKWLADFCLYTALKGKFGGAEWPEWGEDLARREGGALETARTELAEEVAFQQYVQFLFFRHWGRLREDANRRGIRILGDVPIYVAFDSADVWAHGRLFALDEAGRPEAVAGVPPDYFSETGQLWGNPLYRWDRMEEEGFAWWVARMRQSFRLADVVRIDHFRGFAAHWEVPAGAETAAGGRWVSGPGRKLFDALRAALGELPIVAENLGHITPDVEELLEVTGFPGMNVLQFAFSEPDGQHLPHHYERNSVVYTGTHDNDTARGWFASLAEEERGRVLDYLGCGEEGIEWALIRAAYASVAERAVIPVQDVFGLGSEARMNTPGRAAGNWAWRAAPRQFRPQLAARLRRLAELTGRRRSEEPPEG